MFSASIQTRPVAPSPVVPTPSPSSVPERISLELANKHIHALVIPDFKSEVAEALLRGDRPDAPGAPGILEGMGELQQRLAAYPEPHFLDRIASFVDREINIGWYAREDYRRFLGTEGWRDLNSLIPGIAALGSQFNGTERLALYAGTLRLFGDQDVNITTAPDERSSRRCIYNALFCVPAVIDDLNELAIRYGALDAFLDHVQKHLGINSLFLQPPVS
jgi:hypothetical protein